MYSISTHNGSSVSRQHNRRNRRVTDKENHIRKDGYHETWLDIPPREAYRQIFGEAVKEYNERTKASGHPELEIKDYYKKICDDKRKHPVYEMIVSIGNYDNHPDEETARQILKEYYADWSRRNPTLILIGAYYHADETKGADGEAYGHAHLDYIPVSNNNTRGMRVQNALVKALEQQGYTGESASQTAQMAWEKAENQHLEKICNKHGLEIEHPDLKRKDYIKIKEYRQIKRVEELEKKTGQLEQDNLKLQDRNSQLEHKNKDLQKKNEELMKRVSMLVDKHNEIIDDINELENATVERAEEILETYNNIDRTIIR